MVFHWTTAVNEYKWSNPTVFTKAGIKWLEMEEFTPLTLSCDSIVGISPLCTFLM